MDNLIDGNVLLWKFDRPRPEKGCYFLTCAFCGNQEIFSFKCTSPEMYVDEGVPYYTCDRCSQRLRFKGKYRDYLLSAAWQAKRESALNNAGHKCQLCAGTKRLQVHHNSYKNLGDEPLRDLIVLCNMCHGRFHFSQAEIA